MRSLVLLKDMDPSDLIIKWRITEMCNINCSYCIHKCNTQKEIDKNLIEEQSSRLKDVAKEISRLIDSSNCENAKIDLIGGEVTIFNLNEILCNISSKRLKKINITTNLIRDVEYYEQLNSYLKSKGYELSMTASFHFEYQDIDKYFFKINKLKYQIKLLSCEMVHTSDNSDLVEEFKNRCEDISVDYLVDADLRISKFNFRTNNVIKSCGKKSNKNPRYHAVFSDNTEQDYITRNNFLTDDTVEQIWLKRGIMSKGYCCTVSYDFIYIDFDTAVGRTFDNPDCTQRIKIEDFVLVSPSPCIHDKCTICGHMSLYLP